MKKYLIFLILLTACKDSAIDVRSRLSLAGEWKFRIDSLDQGIENKWYQNTFEEIVILPGSMAENGKGDDITLKTPWTGDIIDKSYFTEQKYAKYREEGNIKIPFWLKPVKYYKGPAWYQKEFDIPSGWENKHVILVLERPHWESTVYINGKPAGTQNSLAVPHEFDISDLLISGRNLICIRMDNSIVIPVGVNSHSISDHTQSNWNGIAGDISLRASSDVFISDLKIYPDIGAKSAKMQLEIVNNSGNPYSGEVSFRVEGINHTSSQKFKKQVVKAKTDSDHLQVIIDYPLGEEVKLWNEFTASLYRVKVTLKGSDGNIIDQDSENFGMREFRVEGTRFSVNGMPVFLRGTTECCVFPLTGYPPTDYESWAKVLETCKDYGLNHVRFHSYCPPEAAFDAADRLGIYFHVECSSWANSGTSVGDGGEIDRFIYDESDRIISEYGNHPSFCMLAYGNEPAGNNQNEYLGKLLEYWKSIDRRRVYTSAAGWPVIPANDYNLIPEPRIQNWGAGLKSIINGEPPQSMYDFGRIISKYTVPVVSHEIGQWCVYPDFKEIDKYTGVLKATNLEIFRESLIENNMGDQAEDFLIASGKLQVLCYKAEIEAALRTPGFGGFEILQLHDFPGQGTALVGILNPFFESKGYVTPEEFRMFCSKTVPLARMKKMVFTNQENFSADIEFAHFGESPLKNVFVVSVIYDEGSKIVYRDSVLLSEIAIGNCIPAGSVLFDLSGIKTPRKLTLVVSINSNSVIKNSWDFWVYPETREINHGKVLVTEKLDRLAEAELKRGGSVLLLNYGNVSKNKGGDVAIGFSSIFWNTAWTQDQPPHTLGILCDPLHPVFRDFPTESHSNWQWWDPVSHSQAMILDGFPGNFKPLIQPVDTWFRNRRLALAFEAKVNGGKLMVCSIDLKGRIDERIVSKQLLHSILKYMNSDNFKPLNEIDIISVKELTADAI